MKGNETSYISSIDFLFSFNLKIFFHSQQNFVVYALLLNCNISKSSKASSILKAFFGWISNFL